MSHKALFGTGRYSVISEKEVTFDFEPDAAEVTIAVPKGCWTRIPLPSDKSRQKGSSIQLTISAVMRFPIWYLEPHCFT